METPRKFITAIINKFTWCFHKENNYIFNRHANIQRTYKFKLDKLILLIKRRKKIVQKTVYI